MCECAKAGTITYSLVWTRDYRLEEEELPTEEAPRLSPVVQLRSPLLIIAGGREHCQVYQEGDPTTVAKKKSCLLSPTTRLSAATTTRRRRRVACCHYNKDCLLPLQLKNILLSKILLLLTKSHPRRNLYHEEKFAQPRETKSRSQPRVADYLLSTSTLSQTRNPHHLNLLATLLRTVAKTLTRVQEGRRSNKLQRKNTTTENTILKPTKISHSTPS